MAVIDLKRCTLKIKDGGGNSITVKFGGGNLTYDEKRNIEYIKDRGLLDAVREGDEEPLEVKFEGQWIFVTNGSGGGATPTIEDALKNVGPASAWVTSDADTCQPYAVDLEFIYTPPCDADDPETLIFPDFRYEALSHDTKAGTVSVSGKCNATTPTATRGAVSS